MALTPEERDVLGTWTAWVRDHPEATMVGLTAGETDLVEAYSLIGPENMAKPDPGAMASLRERLARLPKSSDPQHAGRGSQRRVAFPHMEAISVIGARVIHGTEPDAQPGTVVAVGVVGPPEAPRWTFLLKIGTEFVGVPADEVRLDESVRQPDSLPV